MAAPHDEPGRAAATRRPLQRLQQALRLLASQRLLRNAQPATPAATATATAPAASSPGLPAPAAERSAQHPAWVIVLSSLWLAGPANLALWQALQGLPELQTLRGFGFALMLGLMTACVITALLCLLAWRATLKPAITLLLLMAAFGAYFMRAYGIVIDSTMIVNVLQTDLRESRDLLSLRLLGTVTLLALLPAALLWRSPLQRLRWTRQVLSNALLFIAACAVLTGATLLIFQDFAAVMRNHRQVRFLINPLNTLYALGDLAAAPFKRDDSVLHRLGEDARLGPSYAAHSRPALLLLVIGETARSGNFGINGYARATTPRLSEEAVVSLRNVWSCGTSTATALPCMFSHLGREAFEARSFASENLLDVLQRAGLAVLWLDNQSGCKGLCDRVANASTTGQNHPELCPNGECFDEILLQQLDARIAALAPAARARGVVLVLHPIGSHGPAYYKRTPPAFKTFVPECPSNALQQCSREQVINTYDNTIVYTDHLLFLAINWLKARASTADTAMIYIADHGESLGENNLYLHGLPYALAPDVQKRVPWITWTSAALRQRRRLDMACLGQQQERRLSHDNLFHSVLGLLDLQTSVYRPELDIYAACSGAGG